MPLDLSGLSTQYSGAFGEEKKKRNPIVAGASAGTDNLQELGYNAIGAVADVFGLDRGKNWALDRAFLNQMEAQENGRPDLERVEDQDFSTIVPYAAYQLSKQVPQIAGALAAGAVTGGSGAVPAFAARGAASLPTVVGGGGLRAGMDFAARRAALEAGQKFAGNVIGGAGVGSVLGAGAMYGESVEAGDPNALGALAAGPLYGFTEGIPTAILGGTLAKGAFTGGLTKRMAKAGAVNLLGGVTSELAQNEMEMGFNPTLSDEEIFSRRLNSAVAGGMAEGTIGTLGGIRARRIASGEPVDLMKDEPAPEVSSSDLPTLEPGEVQGNLFEQPGEASYLPGYEPTSGVDPLAELPAMRNQANALMYGLQQADAAQDADAFYQYQNALMELAPRLEQLEELAARQQAPNAQRQDPLPLFDSSNDLLKSYDPDEGPSFNRAEEVAEPQVAADTQTGDLFEANPTAMVQTEFGRPQVLAALRHANEGKNNAALNKFIARFMSLLPQGPQAVEPFLETTKLAVKPQVLDVASQMARDYQSRSVNAMAAEGVRRARPGFTQQAQVIPESAQQLRAANVERDTRETQQIETMLDDEQDNAALQAQIPERQAKVGPDGQRRLFTASEMGPLVQQPVAQGAAPATVDQRRQRKMFDSQGRPVTQPKPKAPVQPAQETKQDAPTPVNDGPKERTKVEPKAEKKEVNRDLTANAENTVSPSEAEATARKRLQRMVEKEKIDLLDESEVIAALENGDVAEAQRLMNAVDRREPRNRYRSKDAQSKPKNAISDKELRKIVDDVEKALGGDTGVVILDSVTQLDPKQKAGTRAGALQDGVVYLFRDGIPDGVEGLKTIFHELFHKGLRNLIPEAEYRAFMNRLYDQSAEVRKLADAWLADPGNKADVAGMDAATQRAVAVDEVLAEKAETMNFKPNTLRQIGNWFASVADRLGLKRLGQWLRSAPPTPLEQFIRDAVQASVNGGNSYGSAFRPGTRAFERWFGDSKVVDKDGKPLVVYHGTPAKGERSMWGGNEPFFVFDKGKRGSNTKAASAARGFFFGNLVNAAHYAGGGGMGNLTAFVEDIAYADKRMAELDPTSYSWGVQSKRKAHAEQVLQSYADSGRLMPVYLSLQNPLVHDFGSTGYRDTTYAELLESAKREGHDGAIFKNTADPYDGDIFVAFEPTQIKSATGNNGDYDPTNPDIRFRTVKETVETIADNLKYDKIGAARRGLLSSTFLRDIAGRYADKLDGVKEYVDSTFKMGSAAAKIQEKATKVQDAFLALDNKELKALTEFMADVTAANVVVETTVKRNNEHLGKIGKAQAKLLQDRFAKMSKKQKEAYRLARDTLAENWKQRAELLQRQAKELYDPLIDNARAAGNEAQVRQLTRQKNDYLTDINARLAQLQGDYFPESRFGDYFVSRKSASYQALEKEVEASFKDLNTLLDKFDQRTPEERKAVREANRKLKKMGADLLEDFTPEEAEQIKAARERHSSARSALEELKGSEKDYYLRAFESEAQARRHAAEIKGLVSRKEEMTRELSGISLSMLKRMEDSLKVTMSGEGSAQALRDAKMAMIETYLTSLPDRSAMKRQLKRKNVAGFDRDMQRAVIDTMLRDSFFLSRMEYGDQIAQALDKVRADAKAKGDLKLQEVRDELAKRFAVGMRFEETPIQDKISSWTYAWMLGVSPGYLLSNLMQPFMVSMPMMWARHGAKSNKVFSKAYADVSKMVQDSLKKNARGEIDYRSSGLPKNEVDMLDDMLEQRLLNVTLVQDLVRAADGKKTSKYLAMLAKPSHYVEVVNRIGSALAAYRLEAAKSGDEAGVKYAQRVLADTHFDYSADNAPYWMRPGVVPMSKVLFQFRKYQVGMVSLFAKTVAASVKGETKDVRDEARWQLVGLLSTHLAIGGALGMPAAGTFAMVANLVAAAFGDDDGEPWDAETELRNYLTDMVGKDAADVIAKGLPTLVGADMSKKVGLGDILNPVPTLRDDKEGRDLYLEILASSAGPFMGGIVPRLFEGAASMARGDLLKAAESAVPKWIADPLKAGRFATEGITTRSGTTALGADELTAWDAFLQSTGVPVAKITDSYEGRAAIEERKQSLTKRAAEVKNQWVKARKAGDSDAANDVWQEIRTKVNPARVRNGLKPITQGDLYRFMNQRGKQEASYSEFGGNVGSNAKMAEVGRFAQ